ncbi:hypothetical protein [Crocosphaera sp. Alani8]|uniref:hypothetical protein n=1 Tax=Crocosphaera sp. Alani8 TaxID=3038952 RepID=UPI00313EC16D
MTQTFLEPRDNPLPSPTEGNSIEDNTIAFHTNQIADYLENIVSNFQEQKEFSLDCLKIEENLQFLIKTSDQSMTKKEHLHYDAIINAAFGAKMILSEIFFGSSSGNNTKINSKLLMIQNNGQKLKLLAGLVGN